MRFKQRWFILFVLILFIINLPIRLLADGTYYLAATAYDTDGNESNFSIELDHTFETAPPAIVVNFKKTGTKGPAVYQITINQIE